MVRQGAGGFYYDLPPKLRRFYRAGFVTAPLFVAAVLALPQLGLWPTVLIIAGLILMVELPLLVGAVREQDERRRGQGRR
jgi:hypothetical protein